MAMPHRFSVILILLFCFQTGHAEWIKQNTKSLSWFKDVFFVDPQKGWVVGSDGVMMSTNDGGRTWVRSAKFTTDGFVQIYFTSEATGWLLCERDTFARGSKAASYLRKTIDGGRTWESVEFDDGGRYRITRLAFSKDGTGIAFGEAGVFYKLQEDGTSWKKFPSSVHFLLLGGAFSDGVDGALVGAAGTIVYTENSGMAWGRASILGDVDTRFNSVYFSGGGAWAVGTKGRIFHATGGGRLWRQVDSGTTADLNDVCFTSDVHGWAVGDHGTIIRTRDGGKTWYPADSHVTHRLEKVFFNGERGWAVGFGGTLLAYDPGSVTNSDPAQPPALQKRN
jgi:photosystem II stability/assembly factor-like uncharacterized protein